MRCWCDSAWALDNVSAYNSIQIANWKHLIPKINSNQKKASTSVSFNGKQGKKNPAETETIIPTDPSLALHTFSPLHWPETVQVFVATLYCWRRHLMLTGFHHVLNLNLNVNVILRYTRTEREGMNRRRSPWTKCEEEGKKMKLAWHSSSSQPSPLC